MYNEKIDTMIANAMKSGNKLELEVYRGIKTTFMNYKTAKAGNTLTDEIELSLINKMAAQRKDSIEQYTQGNRLDLAEKEKQELNILLTLLPKEPTENEIVDKVREYIATLPNKPTMADMKGVMTFVKSFYPTINGGVVSKIFRENI